MKNGGLVLWNAIAICEMFKTCWVDGKTPYERRFGISFNGPVIPFGATVENHPVLAKDLSRLHQCGKTDLPGIFLGYIFIDHGGIRKGDIMAADIEELENVDASKIHMKAQCKRSVNAKRVEHFIFPIADGDSTIVWKRSCLESENPL